MYFFVALCKTRAFTGNLRALELEPSLMWVSGSCERFSAPGQERRDAPVCPPADDRRKWFAYCYCDHQVGKSREGSS